MIEPDGREAGQDLAEAFSAVLDFQPKWEWINTPAMEERGRLIRDRCPELIRTLLKQLERDLTVNVSVEGSDGAGRKARVPWVRLFARSRSRSATKGWYVVYLFAGDGTGLYLSLNQGTTDPLTGYRGRGATYLRERIGWAQQQLRAQAVSTADLLTEIDLRDSGSLAGSYQAGNVAATYYSRESLLSGVQLREDLGRLLGALQILYRAEDSLGSLPEGYGPGEALAGFSLPRPFVSAELVEVPNEPGVHVFWDRDARLLYAGESSKQRDRLRQHLTGGSQSSILREKIERILRQDLGREDVKDKEVTAYLNGGQFSWKVSSTPGSLKARIMDELRPTLNDVRPSVKDADRNVLAIYVGQSAERNFQVGIETRTWGFPVQRDDYRVIDVGDWILLGSGYTGGSPRTSSDDWRARGLERAILGRITKAPYVDESPHWPDERVGEVKYPYRVQFELADNVAGLSMGDGTVSSEVAEALRLSAINRGGGYVVPAAGRLFSMTSPEPAEPEPPILDLLRICSEFAGAVTEANLQFGPNHLDFIRSFVVSLATKGFALLTGLSGSGKTRIAIAFGQWLGRDRYKVIAVRPDWTGPELLLGYEDALLTAAKDGRRAWHVPEVFEFILRAVRDPVHPYLLVLDEMNLAHVERYFADLLSGMESGEGVLHNVVEESDGLWRIPPGSRELLPVPPNLLVVGTVNVDETTYMFSPKVLDRANTLEFRVGSEDLRVDALPPSPLAAGQDALVRGFLAIATDRLFQSAHPASNRDLLAAKLVDLHKGLRTYGFEFGHRVFSEAMRFAALLEAAGETSQWRALDLLVKQKVLPRMHGTARRLTAPLNLVGRFCLDLTVAASATGGAMDAEGEPDSAAALTDSFDKVRRMMRSLRANQFASFSE